MGGLQVGVDVLRRQDLYVQFPGLGHNTVLAGVSLDQPLLHSPVQGSIRWTLRTVVVLRLLSWFFPMCILPLSNNSL